MACGLRAMPLAASSPRSNVAVSSSGPRWLSRVMITVVISRRTSGFCRLASVHSASAAVLRSMS